MTPQSDYRQNSIRMWNAAAMWPVTAMSCAQAYTSTLMRAWPDAVTRAAGASVEMADRTADAAEDMAATTTDTAAELATAASDASGTVADAAADKTADVTANAAPGAAKDGADAHAGGFHAFEETARAIETGQPH